MPAVDGPFRVGLGWDRHRLEPLPPHGHGRPLILGGVRLDHHTGPVGHSDGDALLHAITDALLGAVGQPDIGQLFPDDDPRNEAADSAIFLREALQRVRHAGYALTNLDAVVALERPKLAPAKDQIRDNLAHLLDVTPSAISLKGKTGEKIGPVGEGLAIEVHAVALLHKLQP